jgi:hypothetical protein
MKTYPIIFGPIGGLVAGNGFIARVAIRGRCLFEETGEDFVSALGVNPGAVASDGTTMGEAHSALLERIRAIVFEIAEETENFEQFSIEVRRFVEETNEPNLRAWEKAVEQVRAGEVDLEGVRREDAEERCCVRVELIVESDPQLEPSMNEASCLDEFSIAAA